MVTIVHAYNSNAQEAQAGSLEFKASLGYIDGSCL